VTIPGLYPTIARITNPHGSGNNDPKDPKNKGSDYLEASDANNSNQGDNDPEDPDALGDDATMARSRPDRTPKLPVVLEAEAKAEMQAKQDNAVKWFMDVLGFPEASAKALYLDQTLTDEEVLSNLNNKSVDAICSAVCKPGGANRGDPTPILAIERLKLAVFCIKLYERTSRKLPEMIDLERYDLTNVEDQKRIEDEYLASKDPGPELKPMSIDVHSVPVCFDKVRIILNSMRGSTGIP
jgi:hypothetical protein